MSDEPQDEGTEPKPDAKPDTGMEPDLKAEAEKWKALARKHEGTAKANADAARRLKEIEDQGKGELEKLTERLSEAEKKALSTESAALRLEVALDKAPDGLPASKIRALAKRLVGGTREELEADAEELFAEFVPDGRTTVTRKPNERLRGGSEPDADPEPDAEKVADLVLGRH